MQWGTIDCLLSMCKEYRKVTVHISCEINDYKLAYKCYKILLKYGIIRKMKGACYGRFKID